MRKSRQGVREREREREGGRERVENTPFPNTKTLIVGGGNKSPILIHEGDGIHGTEMSVVLLCDFL